jgi:glycerol-3-phosphate dehydrogenase
MSDAGEPYDVAVIGAGVVGSAIARRLTGYRLSVALIEARDDVGDGTSKANTAILHTGFDATPGSLEARLVREGYALLSDYATQTGIPVERVGAILVAWDDEQLDALPGLQSKAEANGYDRTQLISTEAVYDAVPHLGPGVKGGLTVPDESIICTWTTTLALATEAVQRGVDLRLRTHIDDVDVRDDVTVLHTNRGDVPARFVVNAAGLGSDVIDRQFDFDRFTITPRKGELLVYDKQARPLVDKIVLPVPTTLGKGVLVSPTVYGNVMVGPTAEDIEDRSDTSTTEKGFAFLLDKAHTLVPALEQEEITATYAGLRAATEHSDYVVDIDPQRRYVVAGGIRSTGLTASMAIAEYVADLVRDAGQLALIERDDLPPPPKLPNLGEAFPRPYQDSDRIASDPEYGRIVCFCERVTAGEIRDACTAVIPATTMGGLRRRTRVLNGRCQGFFCGAEVLERLESAADPKESTR